MSMPPEDFYRDNDRPKREGDSNRSRMIARMTSMLVFLRTGFIGAFVAIAAIHLLGPRIGFVGNRYDLGGLVVGFGLGTVVEIVRRSLRSKSDGESAHRS